MKRDPYSGQQLTFAPTDQTGRPVRIPGPSVPTPGAMVLLGGSALTFLLVLVFCSLR